MLNAVFFLILIIIFALSIINQYLPLIFAIVISLMFWELGLPLQKKKFDFGEAYVLNVDILNAFSLGKNIVITKGLLEKLSPEAVRGAYYHELGHVKNKDQISSLLVFLALYMIGLLIWHFRPDIQSSYMFATFLFMIWIRWQMEIRADRYAYQQCKTCIQEVLTEISNLPGRKTNFISMMLHPPIEHRLTLLKKLSENETT